MILRVLKNNIEAKKILTFFFSDSAFPWRLTKNQKDSIKERINNSLKNINECKYWFIETNHQIVAAGAMENDVESKNGFFIGWLAVHKKFRRKGLAREIVSEGEDYVKSREGNFIYVDTANDNQEAKAFYLSLGYKKAGEIPDYYKKGVAKITYFKNLRKV